MTSGNITGILRVNDLMELGIYRTSYSYSDGTSVVTDHPEGVPLTAVIGKMGLTSVMNSADSARAAFISADGSKIRTVKKEDVSKCFAAWGYSDGKTAAAAQNTQFMSLGYNVQTSGKYIYAIEVQLEGSPGISIKKTLVAGTKNKAGSKYELAADVTLPSSYSYLDSDTLADLKKQVASGIRVSGYDTDVVRVTGLTKSGTLGDDGRCEVETIGRGKTRMTFSYSRKEAFGDTTSASSSVGLTGGNGKSSGTGGSGSSKKGSQKSSSGGTLRQASDELAAKVDKASGSGKSGKDWISFDGQNSTVDINAQDSSDLLKTTGVTALLLLAAGAAGETLNFRRAVSRKKKKKDSTEGE